MFLGKKQHQILLSELIEAAKGFEIEVRAERLLHEVGSYIRSGSCRLNTKRLIILDRDLPFRDQIDLLAEELHKYIPHGSVFPHHLQKLLDQCRKRTREESPIAGEA